MNLNRLCPICSGNDVDCLQRLSFAHDTCEVLPTDYAIMSCNRCGFVYDDLAASEDILASHYQQSTKYVQPQIGGSGDLTDVDKARYQETVDFCKPYIGFDVSIVDIGSGKGGLLSWFKRNGYGSLLGIEPSPGCVDYMQKVFKIPSVCADIEHLPNGLAADLVVVSNVFEHLWDPFNAAQSVDGIVKKGGCVCIEVPDASRYDQFFHAPYYSFDMEHINHFDMVSMENLWGRLGYCAVDRAEYVGMPVPGRHIPMMRLLLRKCRDGERGMVVSTTREGIMRFIGRSRDVEDSLCRSDLSLRHPVAYWGCGAYAKWFLERFAEYPVGHPDVIIDRSAEGGGHVGGIPLVDPETFFANAPGDGVMLVTSVLYEDQICSALLASSWRGSTFSASSGLDLGLFRRGDKTQNDLRRF